MQGLWLFRYIGWVWQLYWKESRVPLFQPSCKIVLQQLSQML
ncbi:hypothetical protein APHCRT_0098 [Anaplasma phagocytophilum str. CRT53-1]|uniref:Uncharacterized protein n=1 Tax=Anaplasma phagocytophilum str. CRT53-1 TaxID=1359157 RepID=A0A0F3Q8Q2_ANAPH|nr:hypothetical protein APHCRT_0098 [Anaplasma phagocytophilum str. CRT53-1]